MIINLQKTPITHRLTKKEIRFLYNLLPNSAIFKSVCPLHLHHGVGTCRGVI